MTVNTVFTIFYIPTSSNVQITKRLQKNDRVLKSCILKLIRSNNAPPTKVTCFWSVTYIFFTLENLKCSVCPFLMMCTLSSGIQTIHPSTSDIISHIDVLVHNYSSLYSMVIMVCTHQCTTVLAFYKMPEKKKFQKVLSRLTTVSKSTMIGFEHLICRFTTETSFRSDTGRLRHIYEWPEGLQPLPSNVRTFF